MDNKEIYKKIGRRIKNCREKNQMTQVDLAKTIGSSISFVSQLERGLCFPRGDKLVTILNAINASADDVFFDVVHESMKTKAGSLDVLIKDLSFEDQSKIIEVVELLVSQYQNNNEHKNR